ncbi:MAG: hypothetical protein AAFN92_14560, partial [Bacteroidota bacterium]
STKFIPMRIRSILLFSGLLLFGAGCGKSVQALVESGDYDAGIREALDKLVGKSRKNPKHVAALETAFNKANTADLERIKRLKAGPTPDWMQIHDRYDRIRRRQDDVRPLTPLVDKDGYRADLRFTDVTQALTDAGTRASAQLYAEGERLLALGRQGDKSAAREAFRTLESIERYQSNYKNVNTLLQEAEKLGILYITVETHNETGGYLPAGFEDRLLRIDASAMDDRWRVFEAQRRPGRDYDYVARITLRDIQVSPERSQERQYIDEREITDGEEYVLDENGNVAKDTLGNDIKRPREIVIRADVFEVLQTKSAVVTGGYELYDLRQKRVVDQGELTAESVFENYASTFEGDRRALSSQSRRNIGNRPVEFPPNEQLILEAADNLKAVLQDRIADSYQLI